MGILDQLRSWRRSGVVVEYRHVTSTGVLGYGVERLYREQPALRAVVSFLADNVSSLPLKVYDRVSDNDRRRVTEGTAFGLLARPSANVTPHDLTLGTITDYLLYGWALWYVAPDADSPSGWGVTRIPTAWVDDVLTEDGIEPSAYRVQNPDGNRAPVELPAASCVRFCQYDPMGQLHPHSPVEALRQVLSEQISAWEYRNGVWKNGGRVSQWISRPQGMEWSPEARTRFAQSWKQRFSGNEGTDTGGTPLLEDGMRLETTTFNAREAQWQEATRLAREDVAAVYHVNPSLIWHTDGQTYASAKDNARALYTDTLAPLLNMYENVLNGRLLPMVGEPEGHYVEFDLEAKIAGSFEERASILQSAVGGPYMTRNEARAKLNMRALDGADELIVPLNVTEGGLAGANDTDPTVERYNAAKPQAKAATVDAAAREVVRKSVAEPPESAADEVADALSRFAERQGRRVLREMGEKSGAKAADGTPAWWDGERWDRELADDLTPLFTAICDMRAVAALSDMGLPTSLYTAARARAYIRAMAEGRARMFNAVTLRQLVAVANGTAGEGESSTAEGVFALAAASRAVRAGLSFANSVAAFGTREAAHQVAPEDTDTVKRTKTWHHHGSAQPRSSHAAMDGETVGLDEPFSNGAQWPGDDVLGPDEACNCHCTISVEIRGTIPD